MRKEVIKYNGITMVKVPVDMFKIVWLDRSKLTGSIVAPGENYCNANFFAYYDESGITFRLPVGHLKCDIYPGFKLHDVELKYMNERGHIDGNKFTFDSYKWKYDNPCFQKKTTTLIIRNGEAIINETATIDYYSDADYIVSGIPVLRNCNDVSYKNDILPQGWKSGILGPSQHILVGIGKDSSKYVYVMHYTSTSSNLVYGMEFFNKIKGFGMKDVILLDGGGSFIFKSKDLNIFEKHPENRVISAVITFDESPDPNKVNKENIQKKLNELELHLNYVQTAVRDLKNLIDEL